MLEKIYRQIKINDTIIIHRHSKPDGDALGSQLGLKRAIEATFPKKKVYAVGDMNEKLSWIGKMDEVSDDIYPNALVIVLDSGSERLICDERYKKGKFLIKMDHHIPQGEYGNLAFVDTSRESCAGVLVDFLFKYRFKITKEAAEALYTGMVTDSGRFRYSQTTSKTMNNAGKLLDIGIDTEKIYNSIYVDRLKNVKLKGMMISKFEYLPSGVAYLKNTKEEIATYGVSIFDVSRGMVGVMSGIEEISVWANFSEDVSGDIYCEFRSNRFNVNQVAVKYGGGGHLQASGCTINANVGWSKIDEIIQDLECVAKGEEICLK